MNEHPQTRIIDILYHSAQADERIAIEAPGRSPLTYGNLVESVIRTVEALNAMGYGRNDRIAVVLPNGPEMAVAFLSVSAGFTCAPINPLSQKPEFERYLADMGAKAVIALSGEPSPVIDVARSLGIPVIELTPLPGTAGLFSLSGGIRPGPVNGGLAHDDDIALLLHTSGTISRPKRVPLTHRNVCYAARQTCEALRLTKDDRCLNVMPLFYIHGLIGALLSSMVTGGSVVCTPGFQAPEFLRWLGEYKPTWYTATPSIHQKVLEYAEKADKPLSTGLRLIRSAASPLPGPVMSGLERVFHVPVLEGYGMTEAYQITCNPAPPLPRKQGSVGIRTGTEIATIDEAGNILPAGVAGEIVIRGQNVMKGYENAPEENSRVYFEGWFRTGDHGYLDGDGYLFITGRIKETINRGGEKISPYEVEEAILSHPAVRESVVFPVADPAMGEEVGAAVVLKAGAEATAEDIRSHAVNQLSHFKVPSRIFIVSEIPKSPTGKMQRLSMAETLGLSLALDRSGPAQGYVPPSTNIEKELAAIWSNVLHIEHIGVHDNFFNLGGDSFSAVLTLAMVDERLKIRLPINSIFMAPTISQMASMMGKPTVPHSILLLRKGPLKPPLFCIIAIGGTLAEYESMLGEFKGPREVYALQMPWDDPECVPASIEELAACLVKDVRSIQPHGPYHLLGYCAAGAVAYEMAIQFKASGEEVGFMGFVDLVPPIFPYHADARSLKIIAGRVPIIFSNIINAPSGQKVKKILSIPGSARQFIQNIFPQSPANGQKPAAVGVIYPEWLTAIRGPYREVSMAMYSVYKKYVFKPYGGNVTLFFSGKTMEGSKDTVYHCPSLGWEKYVDGCLKTYVIAGDHLTMTRPPNVKELARIVEEGLASYDNPGGGMR